MEDDQQFCLRWNNHQTTLIQNFDTLLESGTLVDCTLAAEGKYLKAHKVVLSACSPYFEGLLSEHYDKHPVFILKDVKFKELKAMMDYMYRGEVNISQDQLAALLKAAESLQIKGLSESRTGGNGCTKPDTRQTKVSSQSTAPSLDIPHASSGLTIEKNNKVPRQSLAQSSVGDLAEDSASPSIPKGLSSREGSQSPVSRKRKRLRRRSVGEDNSVENHESNSSDMTQQSVPALGIAPVADEKSHADPADSLGRSALMQQLTKPADEMLQLPVEKPEPTEDMIQPKSEYLDDPEESVEDLTLDDDMNDLNEMDDSNRAGPSTHDPNQHPGLAAWHVTGDRSNAGGVVGSVAGGPGAQDEVFLAAHEAVQAQRDSQGWPEGDEWRRNEAVVGIYFQDQEGEENETLRSFAWQEVNTAGRFIDLDLLSIIKAAQGGRSIIQEYEITHCLSETSRRKLVNITVDALVAKFGHFPSSDEKVACAKEIVKCFPNLRDPNTPEGYEIFFDPQTRRGYISWRLWTVNRKRKAERKKFADKESGSSEESTPEFQPRARVEDFFHHLEVLETASPQTQRQEIVDAMKATINLRRTKPQKILDNFPKFKDLPFLIDLDFSFMYPNIIMRPSIPDLIFKAAENLILPPNTEVLIKEEAGWNTITRAYITLLKLLPPTRKGRMKLEPEIQVERLIQFEKVGTPLEKIFLQSDCPCLVALGENKSIIKYYMIAVKGQFLSTNTTEFERAFDLLFKSHFVLRIKFDNNLSTFYEFVKSFYYGMEIKGQFTPHMRELQILLSGS